jgi:murein tripeptide amidase MpaA
VQKNDDKENRKKNGDRYFISELGTCPHSSRPHFFCRFFSPRFIFLAVFILLSAALLPGPQNPGLSEIVSVAKTPFLENKLKDMGLDLLADWDGKIFIVARPEDLVALGQAKILFTVETAKFPPFAQTTAPAPRGGINGAYHSYRELEADMLALQQKYPGLAKVFDIGDSLEKRNIYALKISANVAFDEDEAEVLFLGCHHAREWISVEVPFLFGRYLLENYTTDPEAKRLVDRSEVWIVPLVNPDGLEYTIHVYRYWRKNRRDNKDGSYGVDLNRNYGYKLGYSNQGSSPYPASEIYRGPQAFSEPETKAIQAFFLKKNFQGMITYHSFSQVIMYPWGYTTQAPDKEPLLRDIAAGMSASIKEVNGRWYSYGQAGQTLYLTNGDTVDWTFGTSAIPSYTVELPPVDEMGGGFFNSEADIQSIFQENLPAMLLFVDRFIQDYTPQGVVLRPDRPDKKFDKSWRIR